MAEIWALSHVFIMRHGQAEELAGRDPDRTLTREGQAQSLAMGQWLAQQAVPPGRALVSPYVRARQTFELVNQALQLPTAACAVLNDLTPHGDPAQLCAYLQAAVTSSNGALLIVSHMPLVSFLVEQLDPRHLAPMFPTAAIAHIQIDDDRPSYRGLQVPDPTDW